MDQAFLFLYRKIEQTSVFSSKKYINWAADVLGKKNLGWEVHRPVDA